MKRDDDLIRELLFKYEADEDWLILEEGDIVGASAEERIEGYHQQLMCDLGLLTYVNEGAYRLTAFGHDYLDAVRSDTIWKQTKEGARQVGGMAFGMMFDLAKEYVKQEVATRIGVQL